MQSSDLINLGASNQLALGVGESIKNAAAANGTTQAAGTVITATITDVTTATGASNDAVTLPATSSEFVANLGNILYILNTSAAAINVFPHLGGNINGGTTNASVAIGAGKARIFIRASTTRWLSLLGA